ncbi:GH32 C-terminal domain-containing protein [Oecophyllibacter saccharovorans]|uniref:Glycoside hydrolase family 32 protein n=1 Tax=Oecophyllibacter saccharovorans TaxID=2558360 RepID=A0A506UM37_9PROT|nr:GH32 C-terminal domain-containing protein [Oecophyllibacter saccharovorans]TPW34389.1 hypothetical protein E3202_07850 [Oecophyllibacter saccharovorans]
MPDLAHLLAASSSLEAGLAMTRYYPLRHMARQPSPDSNSWQNDGQPYVWDRKNKIWRSWALTNAQWQAGDGFPKTSWGEYVGASLGQMVPTVTRIDRDTAPAQTLWSGGLYVDWDDHLGWGAGTVFYYIAAPDPVYQSCLLYVAPELGITPRLIGTVIYNQDIPPAWTNSGRDFRDFRLFWDEDHNQLVMVACMGQNFGFFTSTDGMSWTARSPLAGPGPLIECPSLQKIKLRDRQGRATDQTRWCLIGCVQGAWDDEVITNECCIYWVGNWDGATFTPDAFYPQTWDWGRDSYSSVTGQDEQGNTFCGAWLGNWQYCAVPMPWKGFQNIQGLPRQCWLQPEPSGFLRLYTAPLADDRKVYSLVCQNGLQGIDAGSPYLWPSEIVASGTGVCFRLDITLMQMGGAWPDQVLLQIRTGTIPEGQPHAGNYHMDFLVDFKDQKLLIDRTHSGWELPNYSANPGSPSPPDHKSYNPWSTPTPVPMEPKPRVVNSVLQAAVRDDPVPAGQLTTMDAPTKRLTLLVDACSVELFCDGGRTSASTLFFPPDVCQGLSLTTTGPVVASAIVSIY